jgi:TetR/AcrR family transcriptional regulator, cholesterol catabolism regulator
MILSVTIGNMNEHSTTFVRAPGIPFINQQAAIYTQKTTTKKVAVDQVQPEEVISTKSKGVQKREAILKGAARLFWAEGFERTTIKEIAQASGCAQGNIYNHFSSKEEILYLVIEEEMKRLIRMIRPLESEHKASPEDQLRTFIKRHVHHTLAPAKGELLHLDTEMRYLLPSHQAKIIELRDVYDKILRSIIRHGIDAGVFAKDVNEKMFGNAIASMIVRARIWYSLDGNLALSDLSEAIYKMFLNGLKADGNPRKNVLKP